jgi:two-component system LytT family sensor kinase
VHVPASLLIPSLYLLLCQVLVFHALRPAAYRPKTLAGEYLLSLAANLHLEVITYWGIVGIQHAARILRERRDRDVREARTAAQLAEARLAALSMQLQPHFLFNTLNAVSALVHEDPEAADRMLARLGELLRLTLETSGRTEVPLREELALLSRYFAIEEVRFADRLTVRVDASPETLDALVPNLLLQPLAENAIRHGIARNEGPGEVVVTARAGRGTLGITVFNDGPPLSGAARADGIGLTNTRARLAHLYGDAARLELADAPGSGVRAELTLPLRAAPPLPEARP